MIFRAGTVVATLLISSALSGGGLGAQTVERTDTPKRGELRASFEPRIDAWDQVFTPAGRLEPIGGPLSGDTIGSQHIPVLARLEQDVRTVSGSPDFVASLGRGLLTVYQEKRVTPFAAALGLTDRLSLSVYVPIVRVATRARFQLAATGANLGANPLATSSAALGRYQSFFGAFTTALTQLEDSVAAGHYGCPGSPACGAAQDLLARGTTVRDALQRTVYGVGSVASPFLPLAGSVVGTKIDSSVAQLQQQLATTYHVTGFTDSLLLPTDTLTPPADFGAFLSRVGGANGSILGFGYNPFRNTWRYGLGNVELEAKCRLIGEAGAGRREGGTERRETGSGKREASVYAAAVALVARLPTATRDSTLDVVGVPIADLQSGFEVRVLQELTLARRLWLNLAVRAGIELPGTRARRVAPFDAFLVPFQATTVLDWHPGNYAAVDFAPLYRFAPQFAVGVTAGYWTKAADHYRYRSAGDSMYVADQLGMPVPAAVLDEGTSQHWLRLGVAVTFASPAIEGGFTVEQTVSGASVPRAMVYRLRLRISRQLF